jgi:hypothetical protein
LPRIETLFGQYAGANSRIRAEKLEINVTLPWTKDWQDHFCDAVLRELETGLRTAVRQDIGSPEVPGFVEARGDEQEAFFYFLANGTLPWYADWRTMPEMKEYIRRVLSGEVPGWGSLYEPKSFLNRVVRLLADQPQAVLRWILQFGDESLVKIFSDTPEFNIVERWAGRLPLLYEAQAPARWAVIFLFLARRAGVGGLKGPPAWTEAEVFRKLWGGLPGKARNDWWKEECPDAVKREISILLRGTKAEPQEPDFSEWAPEDRDQKETRNDSDIRDRKKKTESRRRLEDEGVFIDNAGLVLLHPFLAPLFTTLEWWDGTRFATPELHRKAVLLTQYMVYPGEDFPEHQLLLNKVLCGYEPEETLPSELLCTGREIAETDELLEAVIGHWKMNGRPVFATVENLRASFLQRAGKLSRKSSGDWLMQVEGKGYDIVLNSLPWGIGLIRHPWMPDMLRVEWGH